MKLIFYSVKLKEWNDLIVNIIKENLDFEELDLIKEKDDFER